MSPVAGPVLLMPLRLEIRHKRDMGHALIRWYPDECQIFPEEGRDSSLTSFLGGGYELTTLPRHISLLTMDRAGRVELLSEGSEVYNPDMLNEIKSLVSIYKDNLRLDEGNTLVCHDMTVDVWNNVLTAARYTLDVFYTLFQTCWQSVMAAPAVKLESTTYNQLKVLLKANKINAFLLDDAAKTIKAVDVLTVGQVQCLSAAPQISELKNFLVRFLSSPPVRVLYGIFPPRMGALNDPSAEWITDFDCAVKAGMAIRISDELYWLDTGARDLYQGEVQNGCLARGGIVDGNCAARLLAVDKVNFYWLDEGSTTLYFGHLADGKLICDGRLDVDFRAQLLAVDEGNFYWVDPGLSLLYRGHVADGKLVRDGILDAAFQAQLLAVDRGSFYWLVQNSTVLKQGRVVDGRLMADTTIDDKCNAALLAASNGMLYWLDRGSTKLYQGRVVDGRLVADGILDKNYAAKLLAVGNARYQQLAEAEWLIAAGYREDGAGALEKMIRAHKSAKRIKIVRQGEPTNNTREEKVAPFASSRAATKNTVANVQTNGQLLAQYLGLPLDLFQNDDKSQSVENADRVEIDIVRKLNAVFWHVCSTNSPDSDLLSRNWDFFVDFVNGRGHLPALRIGENPYGVVLTSSRALCDGSPLFATFSEELKSLGQTPRSRLLGLARMHGRYLNPAGKSIEELWTAYKEMRPQDRPASLFEYVMSRNETVHSEHESDLDRIENILRQNAVPGRIDIQNIEQAQDIHGEFYWVDEGSSALCGGSLAGGVLARDRVIDQNCAARLLAVYNGDFYWADQGSRTLYRGHLAGGALVCNGAIDENCTAQLLAVDNGQFYWRDAGTTVLYWGHLANNRLVCDGAVDNNCLAQLLAVKGGSLYWRDQGSTRLYQGRIVNGGLVADSIIGENCTARLLAVDRCLAEAHYHSSDHLFLYRGETKSRLIDFLRQVKELLGGNTLLPQLLTLDQGGAQSLTSALGVFGGTVQSLESFFGVLMGNILYDNSKLANFEKSITAYYDRLEAMLAYTKPEDLAAFDTRTSNLLRDVTNTGNEINSALSALDSTRSTIFNQLNGFRAAISQSADSGTVEGAIGNLVSRQATNNDTVRAYMVKNEIDPGAQAVVLARMADQQAWIGRLPGEQQDFMPKFTDARGRALACLGQYGSLNSGPKATDIFGTMLENARGILNTLTDTSSDKSPGSLIQAAAKEARNCLGSLSTLDAAKSTANKAAAGITAASSKSKLLGTTYLTDFTTSVKTLIQGDSQVDFSTINAASKASVTLQAIKDSVGQIASIAAAAYTRKSGSLQTELAQRTGNIKQVVNGQSTNFSRKGLQSGGANLQQLETLVTAILADRDAFAKLDLRDSFSGLGNILSQLPTLAGFLQNLKGYLETWQVWKKSRMPVLRRMFLLSALYASRRRGNPDSTAAASGLDALIEWLGRADTDPQDLETMILEVLDCFSARFDSWMTACVAKRLGEMRGHSSVPLGCGIGVYGFLENPLAPDNPQPRLEFFQAPSPDQAKAAAVLRAGSLSDDQAFQVNLSQPRVEKAVWVLQGLQKGYTAAELLGRYAERLIHDNQLDIVLKPLRELFPLFSKEEGDDKTIFNVIDGEKLEGSGRDALRQSLIDKLEAGLGDQSRQGLVGLIMPLGLEGETDLQPVINKILDVKDLKEAVHEAAGVIADAALARVWLKTKNLKDAVADLTLAETVYQQIRGNPAKVQAWLEAAEGKGVPPPPEVVTTPRTGHVHMQRILLLDPAAEDPGKLATPRELAEPSAAAFARSLLDITGARLTMSVYRRGAPQQGTVYRMTDIGMEQLGLSPFDLVVGGKSLLESCARIYLWRSLVGADLQDSGVTGIDTSGGPGIFFNAYEVELTYDAAIIERAAQIHTLLKSVPAAGPQDLLLADQPEGAAGELKQIPGEKLAMWQALRGRAGQLADSLGTLLTNLSKAGDEGQLQSLLLAATRWGVPGTGTPLSHGNDQQALDALTTSLGQLKTKLEAGGKALENEQKDVLVSVIDSQGAVVQERVTIKLAEEAGGISISFTPPACANPDRDVASRLIAQREQRALLRFEELLASLVRLLESCGGGEKMVIWPPFPGKALDTTPLPGATAADFNRMRHVRKNILLLHDLMNDALGNPWGFERLKGLAASDKADLYLFSSSGDAARLLAQGKMLAGFKLDEWPEFTAGQQETTGITFNYDVPQTEAPNCFLLSVPSPETNEWTARDLGDSIANVIDLMRIRTLTTDEVLADPILNRHLPTLYYLSDFARDFPHAQIVFPGSKVMPSADVESTAVRVTPVD